MDDPGVPLRWKLYTIINGFWIAGKPVFASNAWFAEKLKCSDRQIRECLLDLEKMFLVSRHGSSQNRRIWPCGTRGGDQSSAQGGDSDVERAEPSVPHISDSISDIYSGAFAQEEKTTVPDEDHVPRSQAKYKNARIAFTWLPFQEKSWLTNTTELKSGNLLFERGENAVRSLVMFISKHKDDPYCPKFSKPSDLERKWRDYKDYAERNGL